MGSFFGRKVPPKFHQILPNSKVVKFGSAPYLGGIVRVYMGFRLLWNTTGIWETRYVWTCPQPTAYCSWHDWDTAPLHRPPRGRYPVYPCYHRVCCGGPTAALGKVNSSPRGKDLKRTTIRTTQGGFSWL